MYVEDVTITCIHTGCGLSFAVPKWWEQHRRKDHAWFYCPNGHQQHFVSETDEEKLRRERDRLKQEQARLEQELREANEKADSAVKRAALLRKRAAAGTCPCCQRTFSNMAEHMKKEHPSFVKVTGAKVVRLKVAR